MIYAGDGLAYKTVQSCIIQVTLYNGYWALLVDDLFPSSVIGRLQDQGDNLVNGYIRLHSSPNQSLLKINIIDSEFIYLILEFTNTYSICYIIRFALLFFLFSFLLLYFNNSI